MSGDIIIADSAKLVYRHTEKQVAIKIHPTYDYWLYIPRPPQPAEKTQLSSTRQLCLWDDAA